MRYNLLAFAPYKELSDTLKNISSHYKNINATVYTADLNQATKILSKLDENEYDAILSRGGTAELLKKCTSLPVIDISISLYDILSSIRLAQNYTSNFVIIGHKTITKEAHLINNLLNYNIKIITIYDEIEADKELEKVKEENFELVLCDVVTNKIAISKSIKTLLITSGLDSIKRAFENSIILAEKINKIKINTKILENFISNLDEDCIALNDKKELIYNKLNNKLVEKIYNYYKKHEIDLEHSIRINHNLNTYKINSKKIEINNDLYYILTIKKVKSKIMNKNFGEISQSFSEIQKFYDQNLNIQTYINQNMKNQLKRFTNKYSSFIIWGQKGVSKTSIAYYYFLENSRNNKRLITINTTLLNNNLWKSLLDINNGPLLGENNTLIFKNFENISKFDLEKLLTIIHNTNFLLRNNIIFLINSNSNNYNNLIRKLVIELASGNYYVSSLKERKNELSSIITIILNNLNIEYNKNIIGFEPEALSEMLNYPWPGNIAQLQSILKELILNSNSHYISYRDVINILEKENIMNDIEIHADFSKLISSKNPTLEEYNRAIVNQILKNNNGNKTITAKKLGISRTTLWRLLNK